MRSLSDGFAAVINDVRQKVLEEGWFGKAVTPRAQTITLGSAGEQSPAEKLGWLRPNERSDPATAPQLGRDQGAPERNAPDRGIDL